MFWGSLTHTMFALSVSTSVSLFMKRRYSALVTFPLLQSTCFTIGAGSTMVTSYFEPLFPTCIGGGGVSVG